MKSQFKGDGATFSPCDSFRYLLWRTWLTGEGTLMFLMLNPSTADASKNDPTIERCQRRAVQLGYRQLIVANIFAYRSTDRSVLKTLADPVGPDNDDAILQAARAASKIVCAWGVDGTIMQRSAKVRELLREFDLWSLKLTAGGEPGHPLYVEYDVEPALLQAAF